MTAPETADQHTDMENMVDNETTNANQLGNQNLEMDTGHSGNMKETQENNDNGDSNITQTTQEQLRQEDLSSIPKATSIGQYPQVTPNISRSLTLANTSEQHNVDATHNVGIQNARHAPTTVMLTVSGQLPEWLTTEHYTVGPGTYDIRYTRKIEVDGYLQSATETFTFGHLLDGLPLVNRFDINGQQNTINYRSRLTSQRMVEKIRDHHGYAPCHPAGLFNTNANQTVLVKFIKSALKPSKPDGEPCGARILTSIPGVDGHLFCQNMANHIQELDPFDLKPTRLLTWDEINPAFQGYNACPNGHYDADSGEYINFTMEIGYRTTRYHFFSTTEQNTRGSLIATVANTPTGYVNSFAVTKHYIVLVIFPMLAHSSAVKFAWNESIMDSFSFYPAQPTLFYVISREKGQVVANYRSSSCFGFNHVNAFEDDQGQIMVDIVTYKDEAITTYLTTANLRNLTSTLSLPTSDVRRYILHDLGAAQTIYDHQQSYLPSISSITSSMSNAWNYARGTEPTVDETYTNDWYTWMPVAAFNNLGHDLELPSLHPSYKMKNYTYLYGLGVVTDNLQQRPGFWNSIVKWNVQSNTQQAQWYERGCYPSEAIFIPQDASMVEDNGVLVSVVLDAVRQTSFLLVLDASSLHEMARANLDTIIPLSFGRGSFKRRQ